MERPDNDEYFMEMAFLVSKRSTCLRRRVGAVIVKDKRVLSTGYNGSPKGTQHCETLGCIREQMKIPSGTRHELCRGVHAEQNAIVQAAYFGISVKDSTISVLDVCQDTDQRRHQGSGLHGGLCGRPFQEAFRRDQYHSQRI